MDRNLMLPAVAGAALIDLDFSQESHLTDNFFRRNQGPDTSYGWSAAERVDFTATTGYAPSRGYVNLIYK